MNGNDYEGGFVLKDNQGRQSGQVRFWTVSGLTFLEISSMAGRASAQVMVDLDADDLVDLIGGAKLALQAAREFENRAAGVR